MVHRPTAVGCRLAAWPDIFLISWIHGDQLALAGSLHAVRASCSAPFAWTASCVTATRRDQGQASALLGSALISAAGRLSPAEVSRIHPRATVSPKRRDRPL